MTSALQSRLRAVLLDNPDGMTARDAGAAAGVPRVSAIQALQRMPDDSYQDQWFYAKADAVKCIRALQVRHHE